MLDDYFNDQQFEGWSAFQTAKGSLYLYNAELNSSVRLKKSSGDGQGKWHNQAICFFLSQNAVAELNDRCHYLLSRYSYRIGLIGQDGFQRHHGTSMIIPIGKQPALGVWDKKNETYIVQWRLIDDGPSEGLIPLETRLEQNGDAFSRSTHIGNVIKAPDLDPAQLLGAAQMSIEW